MLGTGDTIVIGGRKTAAEKLFKAIILPVKALMNGNQAELGMLQALIPAGSTTIDVGANVGDFTRRLHELSKGGLVIAFERQTMPRTVMSVAAYVRRKANIMLFPFALGGAEAGSRTAGRVESADQIEKQGGQRTSSYRRRDGPCYPVQDPAGADGAVLA